jgi:predicted outer membrane repeat protein
MKNSHLTQRIRRRFRNHRAGRRLQLEALECRQVLSNIPVTTFADVVDPNDNVTSLREAIAEAAANSEADTIDVPAGTYQLESGIGELAIDDLYAVTIQSTGGPATIDALGGSRVFSVAAGNNVSLDGLTITGGLIADSGGGIINRGVLSIHNSTIQGNRASGSGGGLANAGLGEVDLVNVTVLENRAGINGGGIANAGIFGDQGSMVITGGTFRNNLADANGGAIDNTGEMMISESQFEANNALYAGGAIGNGGKLTLQDTEFIDNTSIANGGAIFSLDIGAPFPGELYIANATFLNNASEAGYGGAISTWGTSKISGSTFLENRASISGGAIDTYLGTLTIASTRFEKNTAGESGGAIQNSNSAYLEIADSTLANNMSTYSGGALASWSGPVSISGTSITGNTSLSSTGGGVANYAGYIDIRGGNIDGNRSNYEGGGLYNTGTLNISAESTVSYNTAVYGVGGGIYSYGTVNISASQVNANTASYSGGGIYNGGGALSVLTSTISGNSAYDGGGVYTSGYSTAITGSAIASNFGGGLTLDTYYAYVADNEITANVGDGIRIWGSNNTIGTVELDAGNTITDNTAAGVAVFGTTNAIRGNTINSNGGLTIDLDGDGRTLNDPGDGDYGGNYRQNYPAITSLITGVSTTRVTGTLNSWPNSGFVIDLYAQAHDAPFSPGSSIRYLGSTNVVTDTAGNASFDVVLATSLVTGELVSATATDYYGNTSEFSDFKWVFVSPTAGLVTSEGGAQATFNVSLALPPTADVTVELTSSDATEGTVSPGIVTFTPSNWNVPQVVTIASVNDIIADGPVGYTIVTAPAASADLRFDGFDPDDVQVINYDNDFPFPESIEPRGSLIYQSQLEGGVASAGWTESYSLLLDPGQTLSVLVETSETLRGTVAVYNAKGALVASATAATTGADALVQTIRIPGQIAGNGDSPATYRVVVGGADGTTGTFTVTANLNAALETESHGGPANNLANSAQDLENSFISLLNANNSGNVPLPQRGAVLGEISADMLDSADWYRFDLKSGQFATIALNVLEGAGAQVELISPQGVTLAVGSTDRAFNADQIISDFLATSTGTCYLKVTSTSEAHYSVVVTRNAEFDTERNGSIGTAQDLLVPEVGGRRWVMGAIQTNVVTVDAFDSGSYDERGNTNRRDTDYYTGYTPDWYWDPNAWGEHRSYFAFDLSELTENDEILDAQFNVYAADWYSSMAFETLQLSEVTTPVNTLVAGAPGSVNIFDDLGDGTVFGSRDVWYTDTFQNISIELNAEAIAAIHAANGQQFALGGALTTIDDDGWYEIIFAYAGSVANKRQLAVTVTDKDFYKIAASGNKMIEIETATPAGSDGEIENTLDPVIRLYNGAGQLVGTNDNGAGDGRNAKLSYKVPKNGGGDYYIEVVAAESTGEESTGEYFLSVKGANASQDEFAVTAVDPEAGATLLIPPTQIVVDVSDNILLPTLQASDVKIDRVPADSVTLVDGDTAAFDVKFAHEYDGHYYVLTSGPMKWTQAETEAEALGGYLVTINDQEENDFLQRVYFSGPERETGYWTGMNDVASEGTWVWVSGEPVTYTNWLFGTPDNYWWNENYGEINGYASSGVWNDTNVDNWGEPFTGIIELTALPAGYRVATEGVHTVSIAAGALKDVQGTAIQPFTSTFVLDYTAPQVVMSSIQPGDTLSAGNRDLTVTIGFSETMNTSLVDVYDVTIFGQASGGFYYPSTVSFNESGTEVTIRFEDIELVEDQYSLTLASGDYGFQDLLGLYLDGEYSEALPSGNGLEGGDFVLNLFVEESSGQMLQSRAPTDPNDGLHDGKLNPKSDSEFVWCNARESHDVNDDGRVSPLDALAIINSLNAEGTRQLPSDSGSEPARLFYDVNRDGFISPRDALQVVNYLNAGGNSRTVAENAELTESVLTVDEQTTPALQRVTDSAAKVVVKDTRPAAAFEFVTPPADWTPPLSVDSTRPNDKAMSVDFWSDPDLRWVSDDKSSELDALTQEAMSQATATRRQLELQYRERLFEAYGRQRVGSGL